MSEDGAHDLPHFGYVIQSLQTKPEGLCTRYTVTFSAEKAAEDCYHPDCFS